MMGFAFSLVQHPAGNAMPENREEVQREMLSVFNGIKNGLPNAIEALNSNIEVIEGYVSNHNQLLDIVEQHFGHIPEVANILKGYRKVAELDGVLTEQMRTTITFLNTVNEFFGTFKVSAD
jgi:hypothetical protein